MESLSPIIVAAIGLIASVIVASVSYYFTKKQESKNQDRRLKEEYYKSFLKSLSDVALDNYDEKALKALSESFNFLIVIAGAKVVKELMNYHNFVKTTNKTIDRSTEEWSKKHDELLKEMVKAMREDIFGKEKNIDQYISGVHLVGGGKGRRID